MSSTKNTQKTTRGRKTKKIIEAYKAVPTVPVNFEEFSVQQGVSPRTLRQISRFDKSGLPGKVIICKGDNGQLEIWRDMSVDVPSTTDSESSSNNNDIVDVVNTTDSVETSVSSGS